MTDCRAATGDTPPVWWARQLADAAPETAGQHDREIQLSWPGELAGQLSRLARENRTDPPVVILAGLLILLSRYSKAAFAIRCDRHPSLGDGSVTLRISPPQDETFAAFLARLRGELTVSGLAGYGASKPERPALQATFGNDCGAGAGFDVFLEATGPRSVLRSHGDLFDRTAMSRIADDLAALLASAAAAPDWPPAGLAAWTAAYLTATLAFSAPEGLAPPTTSIAQEFARQVARSPDPIAVECGGELLSYVYLEQRCRVLSALLAEAGAGPGTACGVLLPRSIERVVSLLAVLQADGAYVPLDADHPPARLASVLRDVGTVVVIADASTRDLLPSGTAVVLASVPPASTPPVGTRPATPGARPEDLAYIMYTSGSTGTPKGVLVEHRCVTGFLAGLRQRIDLGRGVRMLQFAGITFDSTICEIFGPLLNGGTVVIPPAEVDLAGPGLLDFLRAAAVTTAFLPPSLLAVLPDDPLPALHTLVVGGEIVPSEVFARWGNRRFLVGYGPTETTVIACTGDRLLSGRPPPIGHPLPGVEIYVLGKGMELVAAGIPGEIWIGGGNLARGYLSSAALTAERFRPHPYASKPGARLYRTGDLGRWLPGGELEFLGRADEQIKIRGHRVELAEVEMALRGLPAVQAAAVVPDGTGAGMRLVAFVVGSQLDGESLRAELARSLPAPMLPSAIVSLERLPTVSHGGKADRARLAELAAQMTANAGALWPADPRERFVAGIWAEILGIAPVGRDNEFVRLGGTSLQAASVLAWLREDGHRLSVAEFFAARTVAGVARLLDRADPARRSRYQAAPVPVRRSDALPRPSRGQRRLWFLSCLSEEAAAAYLVPVATRVNGPLDANALRAALDAVGADPAFQSAFALQDGDLTVRAWPDAHVTGEPPAAAPVPLEVIDLSGKPGAEATAMRIAAQRAAVPLDLASPPLLRAHLIRITTFDHLLLLVVPHLICDAWSVDVLDQRIAGAYAAICEGSAVKPVRTSLRYSDFTAWERETEDADDLRPTRRYWHQQLADAPATLALPADRARPGRAGHHGRRISTPVGDQTRSALTRLAQAEGTTPYVVCLAALAALLGRITGREDVIIGSPMAGRPASGLSEVIGFFVNTVPLRLQVSGDRSLRRQLPGCAAVAYAGQEHQYAPFDWLAAEFGHDRDATGPRLIEAVLAYQGARRPNARLIGADCRPVPIDNGTAKFDFTFEIDEVPAALVCTLEYSTELFTAASAEHMLAWYARLLEAAVACPDTPLGELDLFRRSELAVLNATCSIPARPTLPELFAERAAAQGGRLAVRDGSQSLTYAELDRAADRLARALRQQGVQPGVLAGIWAERTTGTVVALLAVLKAGGAYVPLDPSHPPARLTAILADAGCRVLIGPERVRSVAPRGVRFLPAGQVPDAPVLAGPSSRPDDLAYVIYTSGSTGAPKGVMVTHQNVTRLFAVTIPEFGLHSDDVWTLFHSLAFDFSVWEMWGALLTGAALVLVPYTVSRDPEAMVRLISAEQVTVLSQTPSAFRGLLRAMDSTGYPAVPPRLVVFGGERLDPAVLRPWFRCYGGRAGRLVNMYGITETTVHVTWGVVSSSDDGLAGSPIGRPLPDVSVYLLDRRLRPVPAGVTAEMYVGGAGLTRGYCERPGLSAQRFLPDPFGPPGARMYRTGDLASLTPAGELLFCGRCDDQVQLRGFRIEPGEVQAALLDQAGVRDAAVLLRPGGDGSERLIGYVVPAGEGMDETALRAALAKRLPDYMVPARLVAVPYLPTTVNGKLDTGMLPVPSAQPPPAAALAPPRPGTESTIAGVWADVLEVTSPGREDNFFTLGGDSMIAIRLVARCRDAGLAIGVEDLYRSPTIAGLARSCAEGDGSGSGSVRTGPEATAAPARAVEVIEERYPAAAMQTGIIYECELSGDPTLYHDLTSVRVSGPLDPAALKAALGALACQHDVLRTSFDTGAYPDIQQVLHREATIPLVVEPAHDGADPGMAVRAWWQRQWCQSFDLETAPLARCHVLPHPDGSYDVALSVHHTIADGWSFSVLVGDLLLAYDAELSGRAANPAPTTVRYRDFIALEQAAIASPATRRFWGTYACAGSPPRWCRRPAEMDADPPAPASGTAQKAGAAAPDPQFRAAMPADLVAEARTTANRLGVPVKSVMLAAHMWMLGLLNGDSEVSTGISANGRPETDSAEWAAGVFMNCVPLAVRLRGSWAELIESVFAAERALLPHRRYPLARIQADAGLPPFSALFNYADFHSFDRLSALRVLQARSWWFSDRTDFPLDVELARRPMSAAFDLSVRINPAQVSPGIATQAADLFQSTLKAIVRNPLVRPERRAATVRRAR